MSWWFACFCFGSLLVVRVVLPYDSGLLRRLCGAAPSFRSRTQRRADGPPRKYDPFGLGVHRYGRLASRCHAALHFIILCPAHARGAELGESCADERLGVFVAPSSASGHFVEMFSGLDVGNGPSAAHPQGQSQAQAHQYPPSQPHASPGLPNGGEEMSAHDASTIRRSNSSELAYALQAPGGQEVRYLRDSSVDVLSDTPAW